MAKLTDGKTLVEITVSEWTGNGYTPDWSNDFFTVGALLYIEDLDAYYIEDLDFCAEQANDWMNGVGDFRDDHVTADELDDRCADVTVLDDSLHVYFFANNPEDADKIYGSEAPVCLDIAEVVRLSEEWNVNLFRDMHIADDDEISEYGVYDS